MSIVEFMQEHEPETPITVQHIIDSYQGTCDFLASADSDWLEEHDAFHELDEAIFMCDSCGWWYETGDYGSDAATEALGQVCSECGKDWDYENGNVED